MSTRAARPWLPHLVREMADRFGLPVALGFAARFGGQYLHLPAAARLDHPVAQHSGLDVLAWLIESQGATHRIVVPKAAHAARQHRLAEVRRMTAAGESASAIAQALGLHVRQVERLRRALAAAGPARQSTLPL